MYNLPPPHTRAHSVDLTGLWRRPHFVIGLVQLETIGMWGCHSLADISALGACQATLKTIDCTDMVRVPPIARPAHACYAM